MSVENPVLDPKWLFAQVFPWEPEDNPDVGTGTGYPVETGWVPSHDLYWQPRLLIIHYEWSLISGESGSSQAIGGQRCPYAFDLTTPTPASVSGGETFHGGGDSISCGYTLFPDSRRVGNRHWIHQVCAGSAQVASGTDQFSSDRGEGGFLGFCTVVANPGRPLVYLIPLFRYGPEELLASMNVQITRVTWRPEELIDPALLT